MTGSQRFSAPGWRPWWMQRVFAGHPAPVADKPGAGVLVTTAGAFKGLEADVVIGYGLSGFGVLLTQTDRYVAWTRVRHRLMEGEVRSAAKAALEGAERAARVKILSVEVGPDQ